MLPPLAPFAFVPSKLKFKSYPWYRMSVVKLSCNIKYHEICLRVQLVLRVTSCSTTCIESGLKWSYGIEFYIKQSDWWNIWPATLKSHSSTLPTLHAVPHFHVKIVNFFPVPFPKNWLSNYGICFNLRAKAVWKTSIKFKGLLWEWERSIYLLDSKTQHKN